MKPKRLPASVEPHDCTLLAIDPGARGAASVFLDGDLVYYAVVKTARDRAAAVEFAHGVTQDSSRQLAVVAEKWTAGGMRGHAQWMGLAAQWGAWREALEITDYPVRRVVRVYPQTWRARVLGGKQRPSAEWKAAARRYVEQRFGMAVTADEADAICIGVWGCHAGEVLAALPKRKARALP